MIFALILTLSANGEFEIRSEGKFDSMVECVTYMRWRRPHIDVSRGNVLLRCMSEEELDGMLRQHFGGRA